MLDEERRLQLDGIVGKMEQNNETEKNIMFVVSDFKSKYDIADQAQPIQQQEAPANEGMMGGFIPTTFEQPTDVSSITRITQGVAGLGADLGTSLRTGGIPEVKKTVQEKLAEGKDAFSVLAEGVKEFVPRLSTGALTGLDDFGKLFGGTVDKARTELQKTKPKTQLGREAEFIGAMLPIEGAVFPVPRFAKYGPSVPGLKVAGAVEKAKAPLRRAAEPVIKSKIAREGLAKIRRLKEDLAFSVKKTRDQLDISKKQAKDSLAKKTEETERTMEFFAKKKENISKVLEAEKVQNLKKFKEGVDLNESIVLSGMDDTERYIDKTKKAMQGVLDESELVIKGKFNSQYDTILRGGFGNEVLEPKAIEGIVDNLAAALKITATSSDTMANKMSKIVKQIISTTDVEDKTLSGLLAALQDSPNLTVQQGHWFKQAISEGADLMYKKAPNQDMAIKLGRAIDPIVDAIDDVIVKADPEVGRLYSDVTGRYRSYLRSKKIIDSKIGQVEIFREIPIRKGTKGLFEDINKAASAGADVQDELFIKQEDRFRALLRQADLLRENGFAPEADRIDDLTTEMYRSFFKKSEMQKSLKSLKEIAKKEPIVNKVLDEVGEKQFVEIGGKVDEIKKAQKTLESQKKEFIRQVERKEDMLSSGDLETVRNFDLEIRALRDQILDDDKGIIPAALRLAGITMRPKTGVFMGAAQATQGIEGSVKWGALSANSAVNALDAIERFLVDKAAKMSKKNSRNVYLYLRGLNRFKKSLMEEENN